MQRSRLRRAGLRNPARQSTDRGFPTIRSSSDGLVLVGLDEMDPVAAAVGPGPARRGVLSVIGEDGEGAEIVSRVLAEQNAQAMALLVGNIARTTTIVSEHGLSGAAAAASAFRAACYN